MARKLPGLRRELDAASLFSVAYGEIASSIYFALGVIALHAVGFTPLVLLAVGLLFLLVALSYAEGRGAPETGGAATFVRRAFNDLAGFMTGWVLFLDYLIVIALAALFVPHYLAARSTSTRSRAIPWDVIVAVGVILVVAGDPARPPAVAVRARLPRPRARPADPARPRRARLRRSSSRRTRSRTEPRSASADLARARVRPAARDARLHGPRDVANLAEEARRPGVDLPRSLFVAIGTVVGVYVAIAVVALSAFPGPTTSSATDWLRAPLVGVATEIGAHLGDPFGDVLRFFVGVERRPDPARGGDDVDLGLLAARLLARRARPAAARVRAAAPADARLAAGDRLGARDRMRDRRSSSAFVTTTCSSSRASSRSACCSRSRRHSSR